MDWMARLEKEDKRKATVTSAAAAARGKTTQKSSEQFEIFARRLRPLLEERTAQIAARLGISLELRINYPEITVRAPNPPSRIRDADLPFSFTISNCDGDSADIVAEDDRTVRHYKNNEYGPPTLDDISGSVIRRLDVRATLEQLVSSDLERLLEWLVTAYRSQKEDVDAPKLTARKPTQNKRLENWGLGAYGASALGVVTFFFPMLMAGPLVLIIGIAAFVKLKQGKRSDGVRAAGLAIGLGAFETAILALWIVRSLR